MNLKGKSSPFPLILQLTPIKLGLTKYIKVIYLVYMNTASILIKIDPKIKLKAQKTAEKMGLSLTSVINRYLKHFITTESITFSTKDEEPSAYLIKAMKRAEKNLEEGKHSPVFETGEDAVAWLEKQGI